MAKLFSWNGLGRPDGPVSTSQASGDPPAATNAAFAVPICVKSSGLNSYMKRQITAAATKEMAMGTKIIALAIAS